MGEPVWMIITAKLIVQDAALALDAESSDAAPPTGTRRMFIFGGTDKQPG